MKKILRLLLTMLVLFTVSACGGLLQPDSSAGDSDLPDYSLAVTPVFPQEPPRSLTCEHILIAYFSLWDNAPWEEGIDTSTSASVVVDENGALGTNGYVARMIQDTVGGDIHMILAEEPYPADFDAVVSENHQETSRPTWSSMMWCLLAIRYGAPHFPRRYEPFYPSTIFPAKQ